MYQGHATQTWGEICVGGYIRISVGCQSSSNSKFSNCATVMVFMYEEADIPVLANLLQKKEAIPLGLQEGRQLKKSLCKGDINGEGVFIE